MDKLDLYRQLIQQSLDERAKLRSKDDPVESQTIFDRQSDRYLLINVGWKNSNTRIYGCILHVDIRNGKIWVQHDGTENAIADRLVTLGVPKQDIVLAYRASYVRQYTEYALE